MLYFICNTLLIQRNILGDVRTWIWNTLVLNWASEVLNVGCTCARQRMSAIVDGMCAYVWHKREIGVKTRKQEESWTTRDLMYAECCLTPECSTRLKTSSRLSLLFGFLFFFPFLLFSKSLLFSLVGIHFFCFCRGISISSKQSWRGSCGSGYNHTHHRKYVEERTSKELGVRLELGWL